MLNFDIYYFLISLCIGFLGVYLTPPEYIIVNKTPTPLNLKEIYTDKNGNCYKYKMEDIVCTGKENDMTSS
jgi:hypothetical protein